MRFPTGDGKTFTPGNNVTSVATPASILEYYKIRSFGHTEPDGATDPTSSLQYQIWIDGVLFMRLDRFPVVCSHPPTGSVVLRTTPDRGTPDRLPYHQPDRIGKLRHG